MYILSAADINIFLKSFIFIFFYPYFFSNPHLFLYLTKKIPMWRCRLLLVHVMTVCVGSRIARGGVAASIVQMEQSGNSMGQGFTAVHPGKQRLLSIFCC
jgi:hypothetical protein